MGVSIRPAQSERRLFEERAFVPDRILRIEARVDLESYFQIDGRGYNPEDTGALSVVVVVVVGFVVVVVLGTSDWRFHHLDCSFAFDPSYQLLNVPLSSYVLGSDA